MHVPPRISVEQFSVNLHWSSSNVNNIIAFKSTETRLKRCKIYCMYWRNFTSKASKNMEKTLRCFVRPRVELQLYQCSYANDSFVFRKKSTGTQRVCTGKGVVLMNFSNFERSSSFCSLKEFLKLTIQVNLHLIFKNRHTGTCKQEIVFLVDNDPAESPSSVLVQLLLVRLRKVLRLKSLTQVSFSKYHSRYN